MRTKPIHHNIEFQEPLLNRESLKGQITEKIQELIHNKNLQPGTRLPSERDLAEMFGVNRATVGEAINLLEQRGLVTKRQGSGTFVNAMPQSVVADSIERYFIFTNCSHQELLALRMMQEPEVAALAAVNADEEDLLRLRHLIELIEDSTKRPTGIEPEADVDFHAALAAATHNKLIMAIAEGLRKVMRTWLQAQYEEVQGGHDALRRAALSRRLHREIYDAVRTRDPQKAREGMIRHMRLSGAMPVEHKG